MPFCKDCGKETSEEELRLYSGRCRACQQLLSENTKDQSLYPKFYPRELKHLNKKESVRQKNHENFKITQIPTIEDIKRFPRPKSRGLYGNKRIYLIVILIIIILPFLFSFLFIQGINTYGIVALYTNLIYYGIIGLSFLIGGFAGLIEEDSGIILPIGIFFSILFIIIALILFYSFI